MMSSSLPLLLPSSTSSPSAVLWSLELPKVNSGVEGMGEDAEAVERGGDDIDGDVKVAWLSRERIASSSIRSVDERARSRRVW